MPKGKPTQSYRGGRGSSGKTSKERLLAGGRRIRALDLRKRGYSYAEIASKLGVSCTCAYHYVSSEMDRINKECSETAAFIRQIEEGRLDCLQVAHWDLAVAGDVKSTQVILSVMERRARLLGLDLPIKIAPTDPEGENPYEQLTDEQLMDLVQKLAEKTEG